MFSRGYPHRFFAENRACCAVNSGINFEAQLGGSPHAVRGSMDRGQLRSACWPWGTGCFEMDIHPTKIPYPISWGPKKLDILRFCPDVLVPKKLGAFVKKHWEFHHRGSHQPSEFAHGYVSKLGIFQSGMVKIITFPMNNRRKFRSQTSDNMDRWKAEQGRGREKRKIRREKIREEKESEERRCRCAKR